MKDRLIYKIAVLSLRVKNDIKDYFYVRSYDKDGIAEKYEYYEELLMLLSISDTPIEDLLLYLK